MAVFKVHVRVIGYPFFFKRDRESSDDQCGFCSFKSFDFSKKLQHFAGGVEGSKNLGLLNTCALSSYPPKYFVHFLKDKEDNTLGDPELISTMA